MVGAATLADKGPIATVAAPAVTRPATPLPAGACDAHMHVFGPLDRFPPAGGSNYALPDAPAALHRAALDTLGLDHAVLIQPAPYRTDNRALLDALAAGGGRLRGVGCCDETVDDDSLAAMRAAGVVALRFVEMRDPKGTGRYAGTLGLDTLEALAPRMRAHGMHAQLWAAPDQCADAVDHAARLGMPLVLDHLAGLGPTDLPGTAAFDAVRDALAGGDLWIKLTFYRYSADPLRYHDMRAIVEGLLTARPDRLIWGSDWPFVRMEGRQPDVGHLLDQLRDWTGEALFRRILSDNPAKLFAFSGPDRQDART